ncbi:MAG: tetratricopeptide repeat protein, partial [Candidatus Asgardarchaeia archaeon]
MFKYFKKFIEVVKKISENDFFALLFFVLILISILPFAKKMLTTANELYVRRNISYEEKVSSTWSTVRGINKLAESFLEKEASIMYPPQSKDSLLGNGAIIQYFFYPKKIYTEDFSIIEEEKIDAIILTSSWPDFFVPIKKAYFDEVRSYVGIGSLKIKENNKIEQELMSLEEGVQLELKYPSESVLANMHSVDFSFDGKNERIDFSISETGTEIWLIPVDLGLQPNTTIYCEIESGIPYLISASVEITYANGKHSTFRSRMNKNIDKVENLSIDDLYNRAYSYGIVNGWGTKFKITGVGIEIGVSLSGPYPSNGLGIIEKGENYESRKEKAEDLYQQALSKYVNNNFKEAIELLNAAKLLSNQDPKIILLLAKSYISLGNTSKSIIYLKENIEIGDIWSGVELINLTDINNYKDHKPFIKLAISLYPDDAHINFAMGKLYQRLGVDILAYKYYMKTTSDYPFTSTSVEAVHILDQARNEEFSKTMINRSKVEYLKGNFYNSHKLMKESKDTSLYDSYLDLNIEEAFIIRLNDYNYNLTKDNPSGFRGEGVYLEETSKFSLRPIFFPIQIDRGLEMGTIEFYWKVLNTNMFDDENKSYFLLDQKGSLGRLKPTIRVFVKEKQICYQVKDISRLIPANLLSCSDPIIWQEGLWYKLDISWDSNSIRYYIDNRIVDEKKFTGRLGIDPIIYFGLAPDKSPGSICNADEFNAEGVIDNVVLYNYPKKYIN